MKQYKILSVLLAVLLVGFGMTSTEARSKKKKTATPSPVVTAAPTASAEPENAITVTEDGEYSDKEHVAEYLRQYHRLPSNYITKNEARRLGWDNRQGNLWKVAPGKSIGGDRFGNYEGLLPDKKGRIWYECDIDFPGDYRNAKRILFSSDGLIYYTENHYKSFTDITDPQTRAGP